MANFAAKFMEDRELFDAALAKAIEIDPEEIKDSFAEVVSEYVWGDREIAIQSGRKLWEVYLERNKKWPRFVAFAKDYREAFVPELDLKLSQAKE